jgi:hypothetical protein
VFDPTQVAYLIRDELVGRFSTSQDARTRLILKANVVGAISKAPELSPRKLSIVGLLCTEANQSIFQFNSNKPSPKRELDMQNASRTLDLVMQVSVSLLYNYLR